jgi:hypothetical protein
MRRFDFGGRSGSAINNKTIVAIAVAQISTRHRPNRQFPAFTNAFCSEDAHRRPLPHLATLRVKSFSKVYHDVIPLLTVFRLSYCVENCWYIWLMIDSTAFSFKILSHVSHRLTDTKHIFDIELLPPPISAAKSTSWVRGTVAENMSAFSLLIIFTFSWCRYSRRYGTIPK